MKLSHTYVRRTGRVAHGVGVALVATEVAGCSRFRMCVAIFPEIPPLSILSAETGAFTCKGC